LRRTIAIDFDGTLCSSAYPDIGEPNYDVIRSAIEEKRRGSALILWTCREGRLLADAVNACRRWGLEFDAINESTQEWLQHFGGGNPRKIGATEYWDDRAVRVTAGKLLDVAMQKKSPEQTVNSEYFVPEVKSTYFI